MAIILDADLVIRGEKGTFDLERWVASHPHDQFEIAAITVAELWHEVERATGARRDIRKKYLSTVLGSVPVIPYTEQTAYEHARCVTLMPRKSMKGKCHQIATKTGATRAKTEQIQKAEILAILRLAKGF